MRIRVVSYVVTAGAAAATLKFTSGTTPTDISAVHHYPVNGGLTLSAGDESLPVLETGTNEKLSIVGTGGPFDVTVRYLITHGSWMKIPRPLAKASLAGGRRQARSSGRGARRVRFRENRQHGRSGCALPVRPRATSGRRMMNSRIDHTNGVVTIAGCGYTWAAPGRRLYVSHTYAARSAALQRLPGLPRAPDALSSNGRAWGEGVTVRPPDGALLESLRNGSVHTSLVEEPQAA